MPLQEWTTEPTAERESHSGRPRTGSWAIGETDIEKMPSVLIHTLKRLDDLTTGLYTVVAVLAPNVFLFVFWCVVLWSARNITSIAIAVFCATSVLTGLDFNFTYIVQ